MQKQAGFSRLFRYFFAIYPFSDAAGSFQSAARTCKAVGLAKA
jgi:hypothetical protein